MTTLIWFRRDLRLHDNPALAAAAGAAQPGGSAAFGPAGPVVPVFCLDDRLLEGAHRSPARAAFMRGCLVELDAGLRRLGSGLVVLRGRPEAVLAPLAARLGAREVLAAADVSPLARRRDSSVAAALRAVGAELRLLPGVFVVDDLGLIRTGGGTPYTVFTAFHRRWLLEPRRPLSTLPEAIFAAPYEPESEELPDLGELPPEVDVPPGEAAARERAREFLEGRLAGYAEHHNALGSPGTSRLSPYLHFGCISARELESRLPPGDSAEALRRQLCWRDFYGHVLLHHPGNARAEHQSRLRRRIRWTRSMKLFDAWRAGRTGYPLVDAGMRELARTGTIHNRARMVVGSFLVKDMGIDWRWGERWFMRELIDGDEANNNGNWQWIASVGVDPQPPARRIFNPTLQQRRFDPDGSYVRRYVPELNSVPDRYISEPWTMPEEVQRSVGCVIGVDYPAPVLDHATARREAIERYARALQR